MEDHAPVLRRLGEGGSRFTFYVLRFTHHASLLFLPALLLAAEPKDAYLPPPPSEPFADAPALLLDGTNNAAVSPIRRPATPVTMRARLEEARKLRATRRPAEAEPILVELLADGSPESLKQDALLELAMTAKDEDEPLRAQQVYAQFLNKWPNEPRVPEVLLRQGRLFRQMGVSALALAKFYAVMTSSLVLKNDKLDYYQGVVLQAQSEIAETHYLLGKYTEAADFYGRLLKQASPLLNRSQIAFRLIRSQAAANRPAEVIGPAQDFLERFPEAQEQPEVRFYLAQALKQLGRDAESLQQVLTLLQEQKERTEDHPEQWAYWQQRAGNEIANQFYLEGAYSRALDIYTRLALLDPSLAWQLPVSYQIGLTYERLLQPAKALDTYQAILQREAEAGAATSPALKAVFEMARWRTGFLNWQEKAEKATRALTAPHSANASLSEARG
jgi:tetratricopeptide (TPR) repeat protein